MVRFRSIIAAIVLAMTFPAPVATLAQAGSPAAAAARQAGDLYADLSGILHAQPSNPPLWWERLTPELASRYRLLRDLDARVGKSSYAYDWFCQCANTRHLKIPALIQVVRSSPDAVTLAVRLRLYGGEGRHLTLEMVRRDGWRIGDIINDRGGRFSASIERLIVRHSANK